MSLIKKSRRVKREYSSPLREDQALATRRAIVSAAVDLFGEKGYAAVSVDAVAEAAGVSRATVFASIGGKPVLLQEAYAAAFGRAAGDPDDPNKPLVDRPRSRAVRADPTLDGYLRGYACVATQISRHLASIHEAVREAARSDPDANDLLEKRYAERRRGASTIVADVAARATLRDGLDRELATDAVWALMDPSWFHLLVHRRGWSEERFSEWLAATLRAQLVASEAKPPRSPSRRAPARRR